MHSLDEGHEMSASPAAPSPVRVNFHVDRPPVGWVETIASPPCTATHNEAEPHDT
jgi:hypothetical protein